MVQQGHEWAAKFKASHKAPQDHQKHFGFDSSLSQGPKHEVATFQLFAHMGLAFGDLHACPLIRSTLSHACMVFFISFHMLSGRISGQSKSSK